MRPIIVASNITKASKLKVKHLANTKSAEIPQTKTRISLSNSLKSGDIIPSGS